MIATSIKRILIVPDFSSPEAAACLLPLKEAISRDPDFDATIIDLRQTVIDENQDIALDEERIIELAATRLEALHNDNNIVWNKTRHRSDYWEPDLSLHLDDAEIPQTLADEKKLHADEKKLHADEKKRDLSPKPPTSTLKLKITRTITDRSSEYRGRPHAIAVFGKSAMLVGATADRRSPMLLVDPEYDGEWPWENQSRIAREANDAFYRDFKESMDAPHRPTVPEIRRHRPQPQRIFCLRTDRNTTDEFSILCPRLAMADPELSDPERLATAIMDFVENRLGTPLIDILELLRVPARGERDKPLVFRLPQPVEVDGVKATEIRVEEYSPHRIPDDATLIDADGHGTRLESLRDRHGLSALRDTLAKTVETMPGRKRILIVPDLLTPADSPIADALRDELQKLDYHVEVLCRNREIKQLRRLLERHCRRSHVDLVVTLESGCLLAGRLTGVTRIFANPYWEVWKEMKRLGYRREEWEMARTAGLKEHILRDGNHSALGWFTPDLMGEEAPKTHMMRFHTAFYPPHIDLQTAGGIHELARHIHNFFEFSGRTV